MTAYDPKLSAYFERVGSTSFRATTAVQGAWNTDEQHVAPALGLLAHTLEQDHRSRHADPWQMSRASFDILGTLPIDVVEIDIRVLRPGRTIELIQATLSHSGRPAVVARAWFLRASDTSRISGTALTAIASRGDFEPWTAADVWPGEYVTTVRVRRREIEPGRAVFWMRPLLPLIAGEPISATARLLGLVDIANGITVREAPDRVAFPNLDLTAHLIRAPRSPWIGFDTTVSFGPTGLGLTRSFLHDEYGPIGTVQQTLTVRARD